MARGSIACMKYLLFSFTFIFVVFGMLLVYAGFSTFVRLNKYELVISNGPDNATIALLVVGFSIFFIAFLGCCGALTGNDFMLRTFSFIITVLLIIEVFSVGFVYAFRKTIGKTLDDGVEKCIVKYNETDTSSAFTSILDDIQSQWHCCGANGPDDWRKNAAYNETTRLPHSCCSKQTLDACSSSSASLYSEGCVPILTDEVKESVNTLFWVAIAVALIQIFAIVFSCSVAGQRREYQYV